jgi:hypothetical protein
MDLPVTPKSKIQEKAREAFNSEQPPSACPYQRGTYRHYLWMREYAELSNGSAREAA